MAYFQVNPDVSQGRKTSDDITICDLGENPATRCDLGEVDTVFYKFYLDKLKADIEAAQSGHNAAATDLRSIQNAQHSKWCLLSKSNDTYQEYKSIDQCLSATFDQGSDELVTRLKLLEQRDLESVTAFNLTHAAVKDLKKKVGELKDVACKLRYGLTDPCNSEQMKALNAQIIAGEDGQKLAQITDRLISQAETACEKVNTTFEISVKLAGIHAYLNVASLKPLADAFAKAVDAFKADADSNLKASGEEWKKLYDEYVKILRGINTQQLVLRAGKWKQYSLCTTKSYTCDPGDFCDPPSDGDATTTPEESIKNICDAVEQCFHDDCPPPPQGGDRPHPPKKPPVVIKAGGGRSRDL